jgi:hypothetical protein
MQNEVQQDLRTVQMFIYLKSLCLVYCLRLEVEFSVRVLRKLKLY